MLKQGIKGGNLFITEKVLGTQTVQKPFTVFDEVEQKYLANIAGAEERAPEYFSLVGKGYQRGGEKAERTIFSRWLPSRGLPRKHGISALKEATLTGEYETANPAQLYADRRAEVVKLEHEQLKAQNILNKFGKPYDGENLLPGYTPWDYEAGLKLRMVQLNTADLFERQLAEKAGVSKKSVQELLEQMFREKTLKPEMEKAAKAFLSNKNNPLVKDILTARMQPPKFQIPKAVYKEVQKDFGFTPNSPWGYFAGDLPKSIFASAVVRFWPRWVYNDIVGGVSFFSLSGNPTNAKYFKQAAGDAIRENSEIIPNAIRESFSSTQTKLPHAPQGVMESPLASAVYNTAVAFKNNPVVRTISWPIKKWAGSSYYC